MNVDFHADAIEELQEACAWYGQQSEAAPVRLVRELQAVIERVSADPDSRPMLFRRFRWAKLKHFPYIVVYEKVDENLIKVLAVAHTSRRPGYWRGRA